MLPVICLHQVLDNSIIESTHTNLVFTYYTYYKIVHAMLLYTWCMFVRTLFHYSTQWLTIEIYVGTFTLILTYCAFSYIVVVRIT